MGAQVAVDVWWADLTQADVSLSRRLPPAEAARTTGPTRAADRGRRLVAAALLQRAVAAHRGWPGADEPVEVDRTCEVCGAQHGRPVVAGGPHLSVAHAGLLVVVATCGDAPVGVDVERTDRFGGSSGRTLAWARREAALKAGAPVEGPPSGRTAPLAAPLPGYAAALHVLTEDLPTVTVHQEPLSRP